MGISGASGAIYGLRLRERPRNQASNCEIHLVMTRSERSRCSLKPANWRLCGSSRISGIPTRILPARLVSGSFPTDAMVIAPSSIDSMSAIANGISSNVLIRAAGVILKERRKLIPMVRESPFHVGHLRNLTILAEMGAIIAPPVPGFYHQPQTVMDLVDHSIDRILDLMGLPDSGVRRWDEGAK